MTDPRAAALAEALHGIHGGGPCFTRYRDCGVLAAAILAALPPDWCGHDIPDNGSWYVLVDGGPAALARLRRIEAAARAYLAHDGSGVGRYGKWRGDFDAMEREAALAALRAALEGASE
jgi:hypothetical protein